MIIRPALDKYIESVSEDRTKPRDYISFSDIGGAFADRYFKMVGEKQTQPFDERTLRIFETGKMFEEKIVDILSKASIVEDKQVYLEIPESPRNLKVLGYADAVIKTANEERFVLEIKTINSMAFWRNKNKDRDGNFRGYDHHRLQLYGYMMASKINKGVLCYISKDDLMIEEVYLSINDTDLNQMFWEDVESMTKYFRTKTMPPPEPVVVRNKDTGEFQKNWKVMRSNYLTKIYGFATVVEAENHAKKLLKVYP